MDMENTVVKAIPVDKNEVNEHVAIPIVEASFVPRMCRRCRKQFTPSINALNTEASSFRCKECMSTVAFMVDGVYSCSIS